MIAFLDEFSPKAIAARIADMERQREINRRTAELPKLAADHELRVKRRREIDATWQQKVAKARSEETKAEAVLAEKRHARQTAERDHYAAQLACGVEAARTALAVCMQPLAAPFVAQCEDELARLRKVLPRTEAKLPDGRLPTERRTHGARLRALVELVRALTNTPEHFAHDLEAEFGRRWAALPEVTLEYLTPAELAATH